jgi:predicted O-methyltransferase YrrM
MSRQITLSDDLLAYLQAVSLREPESLRLLREETARLPMAGMQISPDQGQFMALLVRLIGARHCLEIGTFTGYSALAVALALPAEARVTCCDVSEEYTAVARRAWAGAGVAAKIDLHLAPARATLDRLRAEGRRGSFDFAFIDADKENYDHYYEASLDLVRKGGLIAIDNVLRRRCRRHEAGCRHQGVARAQSQAARRPARRHQHAAARRRADVGADSVMKICDVDTVKKKA